MKKFNFIKKLNWVIFLGISLCILLSVTYSRLSKNIWIQNYSIFNLDKNFLWEQKDDSFCYAGYDIQRTMISCDSWKNFTLNLALVRPVVCSIIFDYVDFSNYDIFIFNKMRGVIERARITDKSSYQVIDSRPFIFSDMLDVNLVADSDKVNLFVDEKPIFSGPRRASSGNIGLSVSPPLDAIQFFHNVSIRGTLENNSFTTNQLKYQTKEIVSKNYLWIFLLYFLLVALGIFLSKHIDSLSNFFSKNLFQDSKWFCKAVTLLHLVIAGFILRSFFFRGEVLIGGDDNLMQTLPLFIYSKQCFMNMITGVSWSLWNPFSNNGTAFFSHYSNMVYYPINWIIFLFEQNKILLVATFKTFLEIFLIGRLSYIIFKEEFGSKGWALFSSIIFQMGSTLLLCLTMFPLLSLQFSLTLFLYLIWTFHKRRRVLNYIFLSCTSVLILTSANPAPTFYALCALFVVCIYRILNSQEKAYAGIIVSLSFLTGLLVSAVRLIPVYFGIVQSNRIVEDFMTLHDRFFTVVRLFLPQIFGTSQATGFESEKIRFVFSDLVVGANPQNTFFVYFGVIAAIFVLCAFFIRSTKQYRFWKFYTFLTFALALLIQPFWGVLSIMFFPFFHPVYISFIIPIGVCFLLGHTGLALDKHQQQESGVLILRNVFLSLIGVQIFIVVILTYLFPQLAFYSRILIGLLIAAMILPVGFFRNKILGWDKILKRLLFSFVLCIFVAGFGFLILNLMTQNPVRLGLVKILENSTIFILLIIALGLVIHWMKDLNFFKGTLRFKILNILWFLFPILVFSFFINKVINQYEMVGGLYRLYLLSLLFGEILIWLTVIIFMVCFVLYLKNRLSRNFVLFLVVGISILDLLVFNAKIGYLAKQDIFEKDTFPYHDINSDLKNRMDLKNYRVGKVHHANLELNDNLIFGIPSYVGGSSYLNKRFFNFVNSFDEKGSRNFLSSGRDSFDDGRFLDLSAVRYNFLDANRLQVRKTMLSRLGIFYSYEFVEDQNKLLEILKEKSFPYRNKILLSGEPKINFPIQNRESRMIDILESTSDYVYAQVHSSDSGLILLADSYHEGWKAYVDGKSTDIYRANYNFMSCYLPSGEHSVEFRFKPQEFFNSLKISILGIFVFIVITIILFFKRFKVDKDENRKIV